MDTVNASIPLAAGNIRGPDPQQTMSLMAFGQQMQQRRQQAAAQNALRTVFSDPASMGPDGQLRPEAINRVMAIDPNTGMQLRQQVLTNQVHQSTIQKNRTQQQGAELEQNLKKEDYVQRTVREPALIAYEDAKKKGYTDQQARELAQTEYSKGLASAKGSGLFHEDEADKFPPAFDYQRVTSRSQSLKEYRANEEKKASDLRAERKEAARERHDRATESASAAREANAERRTSQMIAGMSGDGKPLTDIAKLNADYKAGRITKEQFDLAGAKKTGDKSGLTVADKMNPVMLATVKLDVTEGRQAIKFMEQAGLDRGSAFYADEHGAGAGSRLVKKFLAPEKEQEFDVYANKLGQAIASAQSMGRGQISESKIREAQKSVPVMGDSKKIRAIKMEQMKYFFDYVDNVLKTPIKADARGAGDDVQDAADFSHLWK